jgi:lipooligosaccharide transport system permease protein
MVRNYDQIIYATSGLIMPMSLFSGTYFPLQGLPKALQALAMASPLTHAVMATRELQAGHFTSATVINIAVLFLFLIVMGRFAQKKFDKRLID